MLSERTRSGILLILVLISAAGFGQINISVRNLAYDSLVGHLHSPYATDGSADLDHALLVAILIWGSWFAFRRNDIAMLQSGAALRHRVLRGLLLLFGTLTVLFIPIVYGESLQDREFYIVGIHLQDSNDTVLGMRILESATQLVYWTADNKLGALRSIPLSKVVSVDYLCAETITTQIQRALRGLKVPACVDGGTSK